MDWSTDSCEDKDGCQQYNNSLQRVNDGSDAYNFLPGCSTQHWPLRLWALGSPTLGSSP